MKKLILPVLGALLVLLATGCPAVLVSMRGQDLVITVGRFDPTANTQLYAAVGGTLYVPIAISDARGGDVAGTFDVTLTLRDAVPVVEESTTVTVTAGAEQVVEWPTLPAAVVAGTYTLVAAFVVPAGSADALDSNNEASITVVVDANNTPDLVVSVSLPAGTTVSPGAAFAASYRIDNSGYAAVDAGEEIGVEFTVNLSGVDTSLGDATVTLDDPLYPFTGFVQGTVTLTMAASADLAADNGETVLTVWTGNLTATVDPDGLVTEVNDETSGVDNNTDAVVMTSPSPRPELSIWSIGLPAEFAALIPGAAFQATVVVANTGGAPAPAGSYSVAVYVDLNNDGARTPGEVITTFEDTPVVPFDPTGTANTAYLVVPAAVLLPADSAEFPYDESSHEIIAEILPGTSLNEWDDTNDDLSAGAFPLLPFSYDLEPGLLLLGTDTYADGDAMTGTLVIANNGEHDLEDDFTVELWASRDENFQAGDALLGSWVVSDAVPAGQEVTVDVSAVVDDLLNVNDIRYVYVILDSLDGVAEIDENNNAYPDIGGDGERTYAPLVLLYDDENAARTYSLSVLLFRPESSVSSSDTYYDGGEIYDDGGIEVDDLGLFDNDWYDFTLGPGTYSLHVLGRAAWGSATSGPYGVMLTGQFATYAFFESFVLSANAQDAYEVDDEAVSNVPENPAELLPGAALSRYLFYTETEWLEFTLP